MLPLGSDLQVENTDLKCDTGNTEDRLCYRIQLRRVNILLIPLLIPTEEN